MMVPEKYWHRVLMTMAISLVVAAAVFTQESIYLYFCFAIGLSIFLTAIYIKQWDVNRPVLQPGFIMIWLLILIFITSLVKFGFGKGYLYFVSVILEIVVTYSIYYAFLIPLQPAMRKRYSAKTCAFIWILPSCVFYVTGVWFGSPRFPYYQIYIPKNILLIMSYIWFAVFLAIFGCQVFEHYRFSHRVRKNSYRVREREVLRICEEEKKKLGFTDVVEFYVCDQVSAPISMGMLKSNRCTVFPDHSGLSEDDKFWNGYSEFEVRAIVRHELNHIMRDDIDMKVFLGLMKALGWFNPLMWIIGKRGAEDLELSCDEAVAMDMDDLSRRRYANLLLQEAGESRGFTTCLSASATTLRYRMKHVVERRKTRRGSLLLFFLLLCCIMGQNVIGVSYERCSVKELLGSEHIYDEWKYYNGTYLQDCYCTDPEELMSYLDTVIVEKVNSIRVFDEENEAAFSVLLENGYLEIGENQLSTHSYGEPLELYKYKAVPDLNKIKSFMSFSAANRNQAASYDNIWHSHGKSDASY